MCACFLNFHWMCNGPSLLSHRLYNATFRWLMLHVCMREHYCRCPHIRCALSAQYGKFSCSQCLRVTYSFNESAGAPRPRVAGNHAHLTAIADCSHRHVEAPARYSGGPTGAQRTGYALYTRQRRWPSCVVIRGRRVR